MRTAKLDEIVRQKDPALKSAVELLAKGQTAAALEMLQKQDRVREIPNPQERIQTIARSYAESPANTLIVSPDNASRRELNAAVRQELRANGKLAPEDHPMRVLVQRQEMTGAERSWANHYEIGDVVRYARGSQTDRDRGGSLRSCRWHQPRRQPAHRREILWRTGNLRSAPPDRRQRLPRGHREFSVGDRIQFTAPDKSLGVANRDLAAVESISPDGRSRPGSTTTARSNSTLPSTAISTTAMPSPATALRASPPSASWSMPIPASTRNCSIPDLAMSPSPAPATRLRFLPTI